MEDSWRTKNSRMLLSLEVSLCPCGITESALKNTYAAPQSLLFLTLFALFFSGAIPLFSSPSDFLFFDCGIWPAHCAPLLPFSRGPWGREGNESKKTCATRAASPRVLCFCPVNRCSGSCFYSSLTSPVRPLSEGSLHCNLFSCAFTFQLQREEK